MKNETLKQKEKRLNEQLSDIYSQEQAVDQFIYLTVKGRQGGRTTEARIRAAHANRELGTLLRRYDPIAFNCA